MIESQIGNGVVEFKMMRDSNATGNFEVTVQEKLVHSKKQGMGHVTSQDHINTIMMEIQAALSEELGK